MTEKKNTVMTITEIWGLIWGHKWWYAVCLSLCLLVALGYLYRTPKTYVRTVKVVVDESEQDAAMRNLGVISAGAVRVRNFNGVANEMEAFASPDLMETVVKRLDLQTRYVEKQFLRTVELYGDSPVALALAGNNPQASFSFRISPDKDGLTLSEFRIGNAKVRGRVSGNPGDTLMTPAGALAIHANRRLTDDIIVSWSDPMSVAKDYSRRLKIGLSGRESSVIVISLEDDFPDRTSAVLSSLVDVYNEVWIADRNRSAINTAEFIDERLAIIETDLENVEQALRKYKADNNLTDIKAVAQSYIEEASHYAEKSFEVNNQLSIARYINGYLNDPAKKDGLIPSNLGLASVQVEQQIDRYNEIVLQRDRLMTGSGENNPLIADLNSSLTSIRTAILGSVNNLIASLELQKEKLGRQESQILSRMSSSSGQELQLLSLQRQQSIIQNLYIFLLEKREENELASLVNVGNTRMIMRPNGPSSPVAPDKLLILVLALAAGLGVPFAVFLSISILDTTIKSRSDLENIPVPFLAEIPKASDGNEEGIIVCQGKRDMMNEAFRVFRTNIDLMIGRNPSSKVIMFTSFSPGAGKTFNIMNISAGMALKGGKVLMVDLDLRRASLSRRLNASGAGASDFLNGKSPDFNRNIVELAPNLYLLPSGKLPPNPTELLLSPNFAEMMAELRKEYDYVFLDCPPVDIVADANIITSATDLTVFVLRAGTLDRKWLQYIETLYESGKYAHMTVILNGVDMKLGKYGYGNSGRRSYGYGYGE